MRTFLVAISFLLCSSLFAQNYSSNYRRVSREVEKVMSVSSDIMDGVMTYEKKKKVNSLVSLQFDIWKKSKRSFARLDEDSEAQLIALTTENIQSIVEINNGDLQAWLEDDIRSDYGHTYVATLGQLYSEILNELELYATQNEVNVRASDVVERFEAQLDLLAYTKELKKGASSVDSLIVVLKNEIGRTNLSVMYKTQKEIVKALSKHIRGHGEELFYNGQTDLHEAYQKYYFGLLELASADLLADLTKMKYDLVEFNSIANSTESSTRRTLSFFDNEKKLLAKKEARFVNRNLPKAPKK